MTDNVKSAVTITLTILLGIGLQVVFAVSEMTDNPEKAAVEFAKAYFHNDPDMRNRLCANLLESGEGDPVAAHITRNIWKADERGFSLCYLGDRVKHINTKTLSVNEDKALLEVEAKLKNSLRSFFTGEKAYEVHEQFQMVKEDGRWKVCGNPFMIAGADFAVASAEKTEAVEETKAVEETEAVEEKAGGETETDEATDEGGESEETEESEEGGNAKESKQS